MPISRCPPALQCQTLQTLHRPPSCRLPQRPPTCAHESSCAWLHPPPHLTCVGCSCAPWTPVISSQLLSGMASEMARIWGRAGFSPQGVVRIPGRPCSPMLLATRSDLRICPIIRKCHPVQGEVSLKLLKSQNASVMWCVQKWQRLLSAGLGWHP